MKPNNDNRPTNDSIVTKSSRYSTDRTTDDTISRQAAIEALAKHEKSNGHNYTLFVDIVSECAEIIRDLPSAQPEPSQVARDISTIIENEKDMRVIASAQPEQRWIPVTERLPENNRQVLVYAMSVHFALAKYDETRQADGSYKMEWVTFDAWKPFYTIKNVIAWMPLPEPYKEGDAK